MQLDNTRIAVHERGLLDTFDLSLHVFRRHFAPLIGLFALGAVPLMLLNHYLAGWMIGAGVVDEFFYEDESESITRYLWGMTVLVTVEAPLASVFATAFLGQALFVEKPSVRQIFRDLRRNAFPLLWCLLLVRPVLLTWWIFFSIGGGAEFDPGTEGFWLGVMLLWAWLLRCWRPYITEVILLEQNPMWSTDRHTMTVGRRSSSMHGPSSGDLFSRNLATTLLAVLLVAAVFGTCLFLSGVLLNQWQPGPVMITYVFPLSLWLVASYLTVVRFLSYLDLRIRHEGWEVELMMRAEADRLTKRMT